MKSTGKSKLFLPIVIIFFLFISCSEKKSESILLIDVETAIQSPKQIKCSDFIESIEYVQLETNDSCLIDKLRKIDVLDNNVIVQDVNNCFVFDSETGKFKHKVAKKGRGPGEYNRPMALIDPNEKTVFFNASGANILEYSIQNNLVRTITIPSYDSGFENPSFPTVFASYKNWLISYFGNMNGKEEKLLMAINKNTSEPDFIVPNLNTSDNTKMTVSTGEATFYSFKNNLFFKEIYNDTVFQLVDKKLKPHFILHTGKLLFSYKMKFEGGYPRQDYLIILDVSESNGFINFRCILDRNFYFGVFSKTENKLSLTELNKGAENDIDGFLSFQPKFKPFGKHLYGIANAYEIMQWFAENPEKAAKLPPHLQKLKNIKESDNPVVMIAKLKE